ncbi:MAG: PIN domain-containing protein [Bacteroidota bacterium]
MIYIFDTNILVHYIRESPLMQAVERDFDPLSIGNEAWLSAVSLGEIRSIAMQNHWGSKRIDRLERLIGLFLISEVNIEDLFHRYAEIDSYSQGRHPSLSSPFSSRNMGKNDLWIAATASLLTAVLLTTDGDFNHLDKVFLEVRRLSF